MLINISRLVDMVKKENGAVHTCMHGRGVGRHGGDRAALSGGGQSFDLSGGPSKLVGGGGGIEGCKMFFFTKI